VPIEVHRFGVGHRRPQGRDGTVGVSGQPIHADDRGAITELAIRRGGRIEPHASPDSAWFIVIEGGGWVAVGHERRRVAAGDAVLWPADVVRAAWTEQTQLRAILVELSGPDDRSAAAVLEGSARAIGPGDRRSGARPPAERADGALAPREDDPDGFDRSSGEPR
jgi:quercetin dioxygenase-like cupin family protein